MTETSSVAERRASGGRWAFYFRHASGDELMVSLGRDIVTADVLALAAKSVVVSQYSTYIRGNREERASKERNNGQHEGR